MSMKTEVVIVGAGPSGIATAACLNKLSIPNIIIEKEDCSASLWKRMVYDPLKLQVAKPFCSLPHMPIPDAVPTFVPRESFVRYMDDYVKHFNLHPVLCAKVESASFDDKVGAWIITARSTTTNDVSKYMLRFLVVATGENSEGFILEVPGLKSFTGEVVHSSSYKSGAAFAGRRVLVVGSGNSGVEIAYDLSNYGAKTSIVVRSPLHVLTKEMMHLGMVLVKYLPLNKVDALLLTLIKMKYGNLFKHGIVKPKIGPMTIKYGDLSKRSRCHLACATGGSLVIDVGTVKKIKAGKIAVVKGLSSIRENEVFFSDGKSGHFDAIVFATGYRSTAKTWLKDDNYMLKEDGFPRRRFPNHWKGQNGLYCAGLARKGLAGISMDARNIANGIKMTYCS